MDHEEKSQNLYNSDHLEIQFISPEGYELWHPHNWPVTTINHLPMVPTHLGRPKIRTFPGPFQELGQINKDLQLTYDS